MKSPKDQTVIQIELTNACIHQCSNCTRFCGHHAAPFFMDFETFQRAVDSLEGFDGTIGIMGGEPTLHPEFGRFVSWMKERLPEHKRKTKNLFVRPQKDFMAAMHEQEWENMAPRENVRNTVGMVDGAGLWSTMCNTYKKNYELIQDVFRRQVLNDHSNTMFHQPILVSRKDLGIGDAEWLTLRENCWVNRMWSGSITPKGCFFCEIAAAMDMLFNGPGGWPIEKDWWKREGKELEEQTFWCEYCGIPLQTFTRDANEEVDDVSPALYEMLKKVNSPKIGTNHINVLKIKDGTILSESRKSIYEMHGKDYAPFYEARFDENRSVLFPDKLIGVCIKQAESNRLPNDQQSGLFDENLHLVSGSGFARLGIGLDRLLLNYTWKEYFIIYSDNVIFSEDFPHELKTMVLNPGTLLFLDLKENNGKSNRYVANATALKNGFVAILNKNASSLIRMGRDRLLTISDIRELITFWDERKVIRLEEDMIPVTPETLITENKQYALFGTGYWIEEYLKEHKVKLVCAVDSSETKWGTDFHGLPVEKPEALLEKRGSFDRVLIGSNAYYKEIKERLLHMGFNTRDIAII